MIQVDWRWVLALIAGIIGVLVALVVWGDIRALGVAVALLAATHVIRAG